MGYNLLTNGVYWGYNPLILTIDPNFLGHPSTCLGDPNFHQKKYQVREANRSSPSTLMLGYPIFLSGLPKETRVRTRCIFYLPGKPVAVNFHQLETHKTSHSCLKKWYTRFSRLLNFAEIKKSANFHVEKIFLIRSHGSNMDNFKLFQAGMCHENV